MSGAQAGRSGAEINKGGVVATTVKRYWQNKAPDWANDEDDAPEKDLDFAARAVRKEVFSAPVVVKKVDDPRLRRLAQSRRSLADPDDNDPTARRRKHRDGLKRDESKTRQQDEASGSSGDEEEGSSSGNDSEEDEDAIAARRSAVRERLRGQQVEEVLAEAGEDDAEEESTEYETDSDDEINARQLLKPVFVTKADRETIAERERLEAEDEQRAEKEKQRLKARKHETRHLVIQRMEQEKLEDMAVKSGPVGADDINTDDEEDEEGEYEAWKGREMSRIARDRDEKRREAAEAELRERLKHMTDDERRQWERANPKAQQGALKKSLKFMQKYWHKGAYYQTGADDEFQESKAREEGVEEVYARDYSAPTGEDKFDKSILPKVMQVKNFGRRGRTKYTHLLDQDTSLFDNPLAPDAAQQQKYENKRAGTEQVFDRPRTHKT